MFFIIQMFKAFCYGCSNLRMSRKSQHPKHVQIIRENSNKMSHCFLGGPLGNPGQKKKLPKTNETRTNVPEIWKFGIQQVQKLKILKIKIHSAQNVGKVWIRRKKSSWSQLGQIFPWTGKKKQCLPKEIDYWDTSFDFCDIFLIWGSS